MEKEKQVSLPGDAELAAAAAEAAAHLARTGAASAHRSAGGPVGTGDDLDPEDRPASVRSIPADFSEASAGDDTTRRGARSARQPAQSGSRRVDRSRNAAQEPAVQQDPAAKPTRAGAPQARDETMEPGAQAEQVEQDLRRLFEETCRERDEYLDALRRLQADFENYRKRVQRQAEEQAGREAERLVGELLPALDAFELAEQHLAGDENASPGGLLQAAALLRETLVKAGLDRVGEVGEPFDPTAHEAVEHVERSEDDDERDAGPVVGNVLRPGYRWRGRVVRPAMVSVKG